MKPFNDQIGNMLWFTGVVEDIFDPKKAGRVRARIFGDHTEDKVKIPTEDLPWAQVIMPAHSASMSGLGHSPTGILNGSWVVGFYLDGESKQQPLIMGTVPGITPESVNYNVGFSDPNEEYPNLKEYAGEADTNKLARGTNTITKTPDTTIEEPTQPYNAIYPNNNVYESKSGHVIEIDDTENYERIHIYHKSGTFIEMHPNGDVVAHHKNGFRTVTGNDKIHVTGDMVLKVDGNLRIESDSLDMTANTGEITVAGITQTQHTHTDTPGLGAGTTSTPQG